MKTYASMEIYSYWNGLRGNRAVPEHREIDPAEIRHLLPDLFILAETGMPYPTFRLTGTRLYNVFGREMRGASFHEIWRGASAAAANRLAKEVMEKAGPQLLDINADDQSIHRMRQLEMLLLPLNTPAGSPVRLLGAITSNRPIGDYERAAGPLTLMAAHSLGDTSHDHDSEGTEIKTAHDRMPVKCPPREALHRLMNDLLTRPM